MTSTQYTVKSELSTNAPKEQVWRLLEEFGTVQDWVPSVTKSYYLGDKKIGVGMGRHCDLDGFGSRFLGEG